MMNDGWIKIHRQIKEWQHYQEPYTLLVWIDLLLSANTKAGWVRGTRLNRGQLITSVARIMESTGIGSDNTVRDALRKLEESGEIQREQIGIGTKITINHFNKFQSTAQDAQPSAEVGAQPTAQPGAEVGAQPGADKQEYKEVKNKKKERIKESKTISSTPLPPKGETAPKKKASNPPHAVTRYDKAFEEIYQQHTGQPFAWSRRENVAVNAIVGKISTIMVGQGQVPTDDTKLDAFKWFISKIVSVGDEWMKSNLTPHIIDSKFNEYYQRIKSQENGTARNNNTNNPYGVSPEYLAKIARELGGVL